jgi:predicted GNAT superfamily acetyltransferase
MVEEIATGLREAVSEDLLELLALNQKALPHVSSVTHEDMLWFLEKSAYFKVIGDLKGFLIALKPGLDYTSDNYCWFSNRYENFFYIDRIVISENSRGQGLGSQLYKDVIETARTSSQRLTCEVNSKPANPKSMVFHKAFGFKCVGTQQTKDGGKEVKLLSLDLYPFI